MSLQTSSSLDEQKRRVPTAFNRVARRYDLLTGLNPGYRRHLGYSASRLALRDDAKILDLCCGTGLSTAALRDTYPRATLTALDASEGMLLRAQRKRWAGEVRWLLGDAMDPAAAGAEGPYDGILMAYGIRNVADADTCLANLFDLLAPGGTICFHEYSVADSLRSRALWNFVAGAVIIPAGVVTSPGSPIYRYLRRSVVEFDGVKAFEERLRRAGFTEIRTQPMDGWQRGIVHSFLAERPR